MYEYKFPMASLAVDILAYSPDAEKVLLIRRKNDPYAGCLALPGGFVEIESETFRQAAQREFLEEVGLDVPVAHFDEYMLLDNPQRDSRSRVVSQVFICQLYPDELYSAVAGDDAAKIELIDYSEILHQTYAFDHRLVLEKFWSLKNAS